MRRKREN